MKNKNENIGIKTTIVQTEYVPSQFYSPSVCLPEGIVSCEDQRDSAIRKIFFTEKMKNTIGESIHCSLRSTNPKFGFRMDFRAIVFVHVVDTKNLLGPLVYLHASASSRFNTFWTNTDDIVVLRLLVWTSHIGFERRTAPHVSFRCSIPERRAGGTEKNTPFRRRR